MILFSGTFILFSVGNVLVKIDRNICALDFLCYPYFKSWCVTGLNNVLLHSKCLPQLFHSCFCVNKLKCILQTGNKIFYCLLTRTEVRKINILVSNFLNWFYFYLTRSHRKLLIFQTLIFTFFFSPIKWSTCHTLYSTYSEVTQASRVSSSPVPTAGLWGISIFLFLSKPNQPHDRFSPFSLILWSSILCILRTSRHMFEQSNGRDSMWKWN